MFMNNRSTSDSSDNILISSDRRRSCHRCGNIRKEIFSCPNCPQVYCSRCAQKMLEEYTYLGFKNGCPACGGLCCCSSKSRDCHRKVHCYKKCPKAKYHAKEIGNSASLKNDDYSRTQHKVSSEDKCLPICQEQNFKPLWEYVNHQYPPVDTSLCNEFLHNQTQYTREEAPDLTRKKRRRRDKITQDHVITDTLNPVPFLQSQTNRSGKSDGNEQCNTQPLHHKSKGWDTILTSILKQLTQKSDPLTPLLARYYGHGQENSFGYTNSLPSLRDLLNNYTERTSNRLFSITSMRLSREIEDKQHQHSAVATHYVPTISSSRLQTPSYSTSDTTPKLVQNDIYGDSSSAYHYRDDFNHMTIHSDSFDDFLFAFQHPLPTSLESTPPQKNLHELYQTNHQSQQSTDTFSDDLFERMLQQPLLLQCPENNISQIYYDTDKDSIPNHHVNNSSSSSSAICPERCQYFPVEQFGTQRPLQHCVSWDTILSPAHSVPQATNKERPLENQFPINDESQMNSEFNSTSLNPHDSHSPQTTTSAMTHLLQALEQSENEYVFGNF